MIGELSDEEVMRLADKVGQQVSREYPGIEADDISGETLVRLYEKASKLKNAKEGFVFGVLKRDARRYAAKERYDFMVSTSTFLYTPTEVRALLAEAFFGPETWEVPTGKDDWLSATISGDTVGVSLMDLKEAFNKLGTSHRDLLWRHFAEGEEIAHRKSLTRAVDALTRHMNRQTNPPAGGYDGPGSRRATSNAAARYRTSVETGHERDAHEPDSANRIQGVRRLERSAPPGTHYEWNKYGAA